MKNKQLQKMFGFFQQSIHNVTLLKGLVFLTSDTISFILNECEYGEHAAAQNSRCVLWWKSLMTFVCFPPQRTSLKCLSPFLAVIFVNVRLSCHTSECSQAQIEIHIDDKWLDVMCVCDWNGETRRTL